METDALSTQMPKSTEETGTETTTSEDLEQPLPEKVLVLHEDEEPDTDPFRTLSDTEGHLPQTVQVRTEGVPRIATTLPKTDAPLRQDGTDLQRGVQHHKRVYPHDTQ